MTTWKHAERQIAKWLNGRRVPVSGRAGQPDIAHPWLSIEVKHRRRLPQWLTMALVQAEQAAAPDQLPIAVLHEAGERYGRSLVVLRLDAFEEWFGDILHAEAGTGRAVENL
jgi:hypothetical protein